MKKLLFPLLAILFLTACEKETASDLLPVPNIQENSSANLRVPAPKIDVCHNGHIININLNAVPAHQAHGDAVDMDGDGYFDIENPCSATDCVDDNPEINPGAEEVCDDGFDNNCNGLMDCDDEGCVEDVACLCGLNCTPVPILINGLNLNLTQSGSVNISADLFDVGSYDNCSCPLTFSFSENPDDQSKTLDCDDIGDPKLIEVWVTNPTGNQSYGQIFIIVQDNMAACDVPLEDCIPLAVATGFSIELDYSQQATISATNFNWASKDVCDNGQLTFSIRKQGDSNDPSETIIFDCDDVGSNPIELWVSDGSHSSMVITMIYLSDNMGNCP
jgi:Putative metal-binding motif